ncbi:hypothetical protein ABDK56_11495 [Sphingomonas sp. ASV193]|uniref:hypothetical protein n=1 Tax=Sphingomonas sp. ASV193 TaxID=3144405 RepID=UPI0032E8BB94
MPFADPIPPAPRRRRNAARQWPYEEPKRPYSSVTRRKRDLDDGGVPVSPNRPNGLSGGAAEALSFDD